MTDGRTDRRTDKRDEANSRFAQYCERAYKGEPNVRNFRLAVRSIIECLAKMTQKRRELEKKGKTNFRANKSAVWCREDFFETKRKKKAILTLFLWPKLQLASQYTFAAL